MIEQDRVYDDLHQRIMDLEEVEILLKKERQEMEEKWKRDVEGCRVREGELRGRL